ncbi:MAG: Lrp/AsnC family transcriptional regulator [Pseudomonadota bacterium]
MIDKIDARLLTALQRDAGQSQQDLSEQLNLSPSQISRRRARLEAEGFIKGQRAHLDAAKIGLGVQAFVQVVMAAHSEENAKSFVSLAQRTPEIVAVWTLTGDTDYMLRVYCTDLAALNTLVQAVLLPHPAVARVDSRIVMDQVKPDTGLPVP